jgi:uncharacterized protein YodC (DUF2158 family)
MGVVEKLVPEKHRSLFRIGDRVSLRSGGANMTVVGIDLGSDSIEVVWMDGSVLQRALLPSDSLAL